MKLKYSITLFIITFTLIGKSQGPVTDSVICSSFFKKALNDNWAINQLAYLTTNFPYRLCGTKASIDALEWCEKTLKEAGAENIFRQELMVENWDRGSKEKGIIQSSIIGNSTINVCALGNSVATGSNGIMAEVIEVKDFDELKALGTEKVKGKIVFFNRPMDPSFYYTFQAYGGAANQRTKGASEAAKYGATAVIVRSLTLSIDTFPHTGVMRYDTTYTKIPAFCICTVHADMLSEKLKKDPKLNLYLESNCKMLLEKKSYNLVAEIKGSEFPSEYITIGGHIDCWDICEGAHDDGAGIIHSIETLKLFKDMGIKPKHTIRIVMFMDEEMDQRGAKKYAELAEKNNEKHIAAIESDRGGSTPVGFSIDATDSVYKKVITWSKYFNNYGIFQLIRGGSGVDIGPLKKFGVPLFAIMPDSQRYFDYHHSGNDTFEKVNKRELQLGSASIAFLTYMIDKYGL
jgi:carboxypeptidase Q